MRSIAGVHALLRDRSRWRQGSLLGPQMCCSAHIRCSRKVESAGRAADQGHMSALTPPYESLRSSAFLQAIRVLLCSQWCSTSIMQVFLAGASLDRAAVSVL